MYTNNPPSGAFRGFGVTQSAFAVEQNMDLLALELDIDPIEFRRMNAQKVGVTTATGQLLDESVGLIQTIDQVEGDMMGHSDEGFLWGWREGRKAYGWGIACAYKNTGLGGGAPDRSEAEVEAFEDGTVEVRTAAADMGQGTAHVVAQCAAEEMRVPYERVRTLLCDTDLTPNSGPTTASRQTYMAGNATRLAAIALREALTRSAAEMLDVPPQELRYEEGLLRFNGRQVEMGEVVKWMKGNRLHPVTRHEYHAPKTQPLGTAGDMHIAFSYATQAALVEVDLDTGEVHVLKVLSSTDIGRAINPLMLQGQIEGGIIMALGNCLTEAYIVEDGIPWSRLLARYKMPSIKHTPEIVSRLIEDRAADGPYGAKGVGEIPSINTTPAICNAIYHATGIRVYSIPVDQDVLLRSLRSQISEVHSSWQDIR
jgi:xanthine dehydrogenase molybdenum-binding subunit